MKTQIDIKSAVFGLVLGVGVMFALGAGFSNNPSGRYQIAVGTDTIAIVDTQTGEAWAGLTLAAVSSPNTEKFRALLQAK